MPGEDLEQTHRRLKGFQRIQRELAATPPELDGLDIAASVMRRLGEVVEAPSPPARRVGGSAWAVAAALLLGLSPAVDRAASFRAQRTASRQNTSDDADVTVFVYRTDRKGNPAQQVSDVIGRGERLRFAYLNAAERPFDYLMILGVTDDGTVQWFHPASLQAGMDPTSIPIRPSAEPRLLREVEADLGVGPLTLYSLFSQAPLHVTAIEALIKQGRDLRTFAGSQIAVKRSELRVQE